MGSSTTASQTPVIPPLPSKPADDLVDNPFNRTQEDEATWARRLVLDLFSPRPAIYWTDLAVTAVIGWSAFALAAAAPAWSIAMFAWALLAVSALYRGAIFAHEISHLRQAALPWFDVAWDAIVGIPLLVPAFVYVGMHKDHHTNHTYGTKKDPEYFPFAGARARIVAFVVGGALLPAMCLFRFLIAAPVALFWPRFHRGLERHGSSLTINHAYEREMSPTEHRRVVVTEVVALAVWGTYLALAWNGVIPWRSLALWYAVVGMIGVVNTVRTLGAHHYESDGQPMSRLEQLEDSIDTPGAFWTELWAPVGLRYHALHHYFPGLPYHNLGAAYRRLTEALPADTVYRRATSPSLGTSLRTLWNHARSK